MRFLRSIPGAIVIILVIALFAGVGMAGVQIHEITHPLRVREPEENLGASLAKAEDVTFRSTDGVAISGWLFHGDPRKAPIVVCHDLGENKNVVINLAIALHQAGFSVLAFDFRGHGGSGGSGSTLGITESRDVLGAIDFLGARPKTEFDGRHVGLYGVGMGAHAAVLAAADRPVVRVLVLDGLWPDARFTLVRHVFADWPWGERHFAGIAAALFRPVTGASLDEGRAAEVLPTLGPRDLLLVAPAGDRRLDEAMKAMYGSLQDRRDAEKNLLTLPATKASGLSTEDLARYHAHVVDFFASRLARP